MTVPARIPRRSPRYGEAGYARKANDAYFTEPRCTRALLPFLKRIRGKRIWECACGRGDMVAVLREGGHEVFASDIVDHGGLKAGRAVRYGVDFLTTRQRLKGLGAIITNPPWGAGEVFVRRALEIAPDALIAMLLPLEFDAASTRLELFDAPEGNAFALQLVMCWRPNWVDERKKNGRNNSAWFIWDRKLRERQGGAMKRYAI